MTQDTPDSDEHHHDENLTTDYKERWEGLGTLLSIGLLFSLPVIVLGTAAGYLAIGPITGAWFTLYATVVLMAATWAFGESTLRAVEKARGK